MSFFERGISWSNGLEDEKRECVDEFGPSVCWRSRPDGRGHIDVTARGIGIDTVSPAKKRFLYNLSIKLHQQKKISSTHLMHYISSNYLLVEHKEELQTNLPYDTSRPKQQQE
ncbi:hypothetical protein HanXRQr2_Chr14g0666431 [Helianthus annuus]|uniref:Uncharacterized protein n=1 Tax=Helianthus annuus TaxID=4232 RepID=A0A9K3ECJ1_HELAN|nr:hypothetical protein HanXRQr2_Chr14g0666431 [Helianthus annuus]KAJ0842250.1 hypothetical protein HanPSC8_Chr14g0639541 [Helianthus annuus]